MYVVVEEWCDATNPKKAPADKRDAVRAERERVLERIGHLVRKPDGTVDFKKSMATITGARNRGTIGGTLLTKLEEATKKEPHKIRFKDHRPLHMKRATTYATGRVVRPGC